MGTFYDSKKTPINRQTLSEYLNTRKNVIRNAGYDYRNNVFGRTLSNLFYTDQKRTEILDRFEPILSFLIDFVKHIKKTANYNIPKWYRDFN